MPLILNGSTGISGTDGSAGTPAVQGTDTNTGMFFPAADTIAFAEGGVEAMRIDSAGNVGIGRIDPFYRLEVAGQMRARTTSGGIIATFETNDGGSNNNNLAVVPTYGNGVVAANGMYLDLGTAGMLGFRTTAAGIANLAIDAAGRVGVGTVNPSTSFRFHVNTGDTGGQIINTTGTGDGLALTLNGSGSSGQSVYTLPVRTAGVLRGGIFWDGSNLLYVNSSDYRLKSDVAPMQGALDRISLLKPCTYTWTDQQVAGEGFIAHELAEVIPHAVTGEKDAVDEDGSIKPQAVDYSKIVVHLVAAMQELKAENDALKARVAALEAR